MEIIIGIGIFITIVLLINAAFYGFRNIKSSETLSVRRRLRTLSAGKTESKEIDILRKRLFSEIPWFNRFLFRVTHFHYLDRLLEQSNTQKPLGYFLLLSILIAALGVAAGLVLRMNEITIVILSVFFSSFPFLFLISKKQKRMAKFQEQLPDALDLIARALRAGHAFTGGLSMVATEFGDPVGTEFRKTLDEINFGIGLNDAMKNFSRRVSCRDLQFFVVSVIIQRETGGNLAEILEKIANLIRQRFQFYGRVRTLAAEGKLSAIILVTLPPAIGLYFMWRQPQYIELLFQDPLGVSMIIIAVVMMFLGVFVMRRMVRIKV